MRIPIYKAEKDAGLAKELMASTSFAFLAKASSNQANAGTYRIPETVMERATAENKNQIDLFYMKDIMASAGWNLNDDIFLPEELYGAAGTVTDKPFNLGHDCKEIIGHQTGSYLVDNDGKVMPEDLTVEELPDTFDLVSASVIYRYWPDKEYMKKIEKTIAEIEEGDKWYVSMECIFPNFDYGLVDIDSGNAKLVTRNKDTAYLTKHLRRYGGTGKYENFKVGRVLRDLVFSGKGLVEAPANPKSVIFEKTEAFKVHFDKINESSATSVYVNSTQSTQEKKQMDEKEVVKQLEAAKADVKTAIQEKAVADSKLEAKSKELDAAKAESEVKYKDFEKKLSEATAKNEELVKQLEAKSEELKSVKAEIEVANTKLGETTAALKLSNDKLADIELKKATAARIESVKTRLKLDEASASKYVESVNSLNEEAFAKHLDVVAPVAASVSKSGSSNADTKVLEGAVAKVEVTPAVTSESAVETTRASIANAFSKKDKVQK